MKKLRKFLYCTFAVLLCVCAFGFIKTLPASADEVTAEPYETVWVNDLQYGENGWAGYDATTNSVTISPGTRFGYNMIFENVEVKARVNFSAVGSHFNMHLRTPYEANAVKDAWYQGAYHFRWYSNGQFELIKNGVVLVGPAWGPLPAISTGVDYELSFSTINLSDGSVKIRVAVNGSEFREYIDTTDPITGAGMVVFATDGATYSVSGDGFSEQAINLYDMADPYYTADYPDTTGVDATTGDITIQAGGIAGGAGWSYQQTDFYAYKFKFTPSTATGKLRMSIGTQGAFHRLEHMTQGYVLQWWGDNGQRHLFRNGVQIDYVWNLPTFAGGKTYEIEYGVTPFTNGTNRIYLKIDGVIYVNFFDMPSTTNEPLTLTKSGTPGAISRWAIVQTEGITGTISPATSAATSEEKTLLTSDLGVVSGGAATLDRNGGITNLVSNANAYYNGNFKNVSVKFKGNFTTASGALIFGLRRQSTDAVSWTNGGYITYLYANGQAILYKNGVNLCEGWSLSSMGMGANTDYEIEVGTVNVTSTAVKVYAKINGVYAINYLDSVGAINDGGWFTIDNAGFAGELMPTVEYPVISTDLAVGDIAIVNSTVNLSYSITGASSSDQVEYYIDQAKSTATATIAGDKLTPTTAGDLVVYAKVNGIYSNDITISVGNPTPFLKNVPETIIFGSANVIIDADMSNNVAVSSKVFGVENASGQATIDATTGEITPVKAGTIKVYATVNGIKTEEKTITIIPVITITNPGKLIKGGEKTLEYTSNCDLPNETITATWEIVSGSDVATIDATTGALNTSKTGTFTVKVTVNAQSFSAESEQLTITVITAELIDLPTEPIIVGGDKWSIDAKMSDDSQVLTKEFGVKDISGSATIDATTGEITPVKAGTIKVYATVNGIKSNEYIITLIPKIFINKVGSFAFTGVYDLNEHWGANCELPNEEIDVSFEVVSGADFITFNANNGVLTAGNVPGVVGLRVLVTGETFQAISAITYLSIEKPIVVIQDSFLSDLIVGQSVTITPSISQGGIDIQSVMIETVLGADLVEINGATITALKAGKFKFKVIVNETLVDDDEGLEIDIENLTPTIIANEHMLLNKTQQATVLFNIDNFVYSTIFWSVVDGDDVISISDSGLITALKVGVGTVKVIVDGEYVATLDVEVLDKVSILGVLPNANVLVGATINFSYVINDVNFGEVETVKYVIVKGSELVSLSESDGKLTALATGKVGIKVIVNGVESAVLNFNIVKNNPTGTPPTDNDGTALGVILGIAGGSVAVVGGATSFIIWRKRRIKVGKK